MVSNKEVQEAFVDYMDGETIEWQLLKIFFHQNGGFSRKIADDDGEIDSAIGMTVKPGAVVISLIDLEENDEGMFMASEEDAVEVAVDDDIKYRMIEMAKKANDGYSPFSSVGDDDAEDLDDPENQDNMYA